MRAEEEVLPMVLSRSGPTAPEDLRAIVSHTLLLAGIWVAFFPRRQHSPHDIAGIWVAFFQYM